MRRGCVPNHDDGLRQLHSRRPDARSVRPGSQERHCRRAAQTGYASPATLSAKNFASSARCWPRSITPNTLRCSAPARRLLLFQSRDRAARGNGPALIERSYTDLVQSLDGVLKDANFTELPHAEIGDAHRRRTVLPVEVNAELSDFRESALLPAWTPHRAVRVREWFGLRRRKVEAEVYDDVVLLVAMKQEAEIISQRELRVLERRKMRPGSVCSNIFATSPAAISTRCSPTPAW